MARTDSLSNYLTDVATAIKNKYDISGTINASNFDTTITNGKADANNKLRLIGTTDLDQQGMDDLETTFSNFKNIILGSFSGGTFTDASVLDGQQIIGSGQSNFQNCSNMLEVPNIDTSQCTSAANMFQNCTSLTNTGNLDLSSCTSATNMFSGCTSLTDIDLDISKLQGTASSMFQNCTSLTNTGNITFNHLGNRGNKTLTSLFSGCTSLTTIGNIKIVVDDNTYTTTNQMFNGCSSIVTLPDIEGIEYSASGNNMCNGCTSLVNVPLWDIGTSTNYNFNPGSWFTGCPNLSDQSLYNIIQMLINATTASGISGQKKLSRVLSSGYGYKAKVDGLSNYQDFVNVGWTNDLSS